MIEGLNSPKKEVECCCRLKIYLLSVILMDPEFLE